ncbi:MAG: DUF2911 domain-containing protein [Gammaproteobacteria bacterium]|nr:DUF2911 domain-containing protein [Gammaproteobacteria bacterium]MDE0247086.1 DUF2911 domain-containing protein [Gammaproteobacteria bacterium]
MHLPPSVCRRPARNAILPAHVLALLALLLPTGLAGQGSRIDAPEVASPRGSAATQVGGAFDSGGTYGNGSWIVVDYGRPILRGRENIFGSGDSYGDGFLLGAPLWRVGANQSTRFMTETDLDFGGGRLPAGDYSVFAELEESRWTLIFSTWGVKESFGEENADALWGSYEYTPDRDVLRTTMSVETADRAADQLIITFTDMTQEGGNFTVWWDDQIATAAFTVAP